MIIILLPQKVGQIVKVVYKEKRKGAVMKRRKFDPETKVSIVLEGLRGETSIAELCRKHQISETMYYKWRDKFLEGGRKAFDMPPKSGIL